MLKKLEGKLALEKLMESSMEFIDILFAVGVFLLVIGMYSAFSLVNLSISKTKEELKDINVANLWVLFLICLPVGLILVYFWF